MKVNGNKAHWIYALQRITSLCGTKKEGYCSSLSLSQVDLKELLSVVVFSDVPHKQVIGKKITRKSVLPALGQECS